jgi:uncharacterized protein YndB with AHSA1/START domain
MAESTFDYVTCIRTTAGRLWSALTKDVDFMQQYWFGIHGESGWTAGSPWKMDYQDSHLIDAGEIVEAVPARRLVIRWRNEWNPEFKAEGWSLCTMEPVPDGMAVRLSVTHGIDHVPSQLINAVSFFWPQVLANLKSLLESGAIVLKKPCPA